MGRWSLLSGVLFSSLLVSGCSGLGVVSPAFWGNLLVLAVTVGIFVGTLSLGRTARTAGSAESSTSSSASSNR